MLDYIEIEGFKTLKKVNLKLEPLNILIGGEREREEQPVDL